MAAFDLNSLYFLKNAAPKTTSFEEAVAPIKTGFDLGTAYNENYNRNSLQNLIAQRESEGVPFDRLSNEAAKWDLNAAANIMRPEARKSIDFNFKQSAVEFDRWRKEMARRICGLILQKSDELGMAPDQQYGVLDTAAHYVVTYDPELAEFLMQQANTRRYNAARTAPKPTKPQSTSYKNLWNNAQNAKKMAEEYDSRLNSSKYWGLMNYALAAEAVAEREAQKGVPAEYNDVLRLLSNFKNRDREISPETMRAYALSDNFSLINEGGVTNENTDFSNIVTPESVDSATTATSPTTSNAPTSAVRTNKVKRNIPGKAVDAGIEESPSEMKVESMLGGVGGFPYIDSDKLKAYIKYADGIEDNKKAIDFLEDVKLQLTNDSNDANKGAGKTEGADKNYFDLVNKKIEDRKLLEKGGISPKSARILKLNGKTAAELTAARAEWGRISNFPKLYYINPGAILPAMSRTLLPEERTTDEDVMRGVLSANKIEKSLIDKIVNAYVSSNTDTFSNLMKNEAYSAAARSIAPFILEKMKNKYKTLVKRVGNESDVDNALMETYDMSSDVLDYLKGNKILYTDKDRYENKAEQIKKEIEDREKDQWNTEFNAKPKAKYTEADWDNF